MGLSSSAPASSGTSDAVEDLRRKAVDGLVPAPATDALGRRIAYELGQFSGWCTWFGVEGVVTEVGWPRKADGLAWATVAEAWYTVAEAANIEVFQWAAWESNRHESGVFIPSQPASLTTPSGGIDEAALPAAVRANHAAGVALGDGSRGFGTAATEPFSSNTREVCSYQGPIPEGRTPHEWWFTYSYGMPQTWEFLARSGVTKVRLGIKWERFQRTLGGALDTVELARLEDALALADANGIGVVLDLHNFARYYVEGDGTNGASAGTAVRLLLGSAGLTEAHLVDFWTRMSTLFRNDDRVVAYEIMNEPNGMSGGAAQWETISQAVVTAVRANADDTPIWVSGYNWSPAWNWGAIHADPWITGTNIKYVAHHYFDNGHDANYELSYREELALAQASYADAGVARVSRRTTTKTINNSAVLTTTGLVLTLEPWSTYEWRAMLHYLATTSADVKIKVNVPAGAGGNWSHVHLLSGSVANSGGVQLLTRGYEATVPVGAITGNVLAMMMSGIVVNGATAGTIEIMYAQNTAEVSDAQVYLNSFLVVDRLA